MSVIPVLSSCRPVVERGRFVHVAPAAVSRFLDRRPRLLMPPLHLGPAPYHYFDGTGITAEWLFVVDTINHCFWPDIGTPRWEIRYGNELLSGYWALAASLKRAMEEGVAVHRPKTLAAMDEKTLTSIFRGKGTIPLFRERLENLREAGRILLERFQGSFLHLLEEAGHSAIELVQLLARTFPSFCDIATYQGEAVYFYKRGQLLVMDLWCTFGGASWGRFTDLPALTAFADYKLPQVLRHCGILSYAPELAERVDSLVPIPAGTPEEVEIRSATVWGVEWLRQALVDRGRRVISAQLDNWLWTLGQQETYRHKPYHRTRTIFY